jgi:hypothetical protein
MAFASANVGSLDPLIHVLREFTGADTAEGTESYKRQIRVDVVEV